MYDNPVLWKELKTYYRMRRGRSVKIAIGLPVLLLGGMAYYSAFRTLLQQGASMAHDGWQMGAILQAVLIWLLCPAAASNAVTQEKEQQSWEMLVFSLLTPHEIVMGKFLSRLVPTLLLPAVFLPFMGACALLGGAHLQDALNLYLVLLVWIVFLVSTSLFFSWTFKKTAAALAVSYTVAFVFVLGTVLMAGIATGGRFGDDVLPMWFNPARVIQAVVSDTDSMRVQVISTHVITLLILIGAQFAYMMRRIRPMATA